MTKRFCDMCGAEAKIAEQHVYKRTPNPRQKGFDGQAKFMLTLSFSLTNHSRDYAGAPDLCRTCQRQLVDEMIAMVIDPT